MKDRLEDREQYALDVISGKIRGLKATLLRLVLHALSYLYRGVVSLRAWLFRHGVKRVYSLGCPVVSVGNLTVGGTGKTPVVELLAHLLNERGRKVAILSRGYRSEADAEFDKPSHKGFQPRVVSKGYGPLRSAKDSGDEPNMLARNLKGVCVVVDRDRIQSGTLAVQKLGCDLLMLDDGLQYLRLQRRMNFVLVDSTQPFGNGYLLPRGLLRESPSQLRRADCIVLTKCDGGSQAILRKKIRRYNLVAPIIESQHKPIRLVGIFGAENRPLSFLRGKHIATMSAIARPEAFVESLHRLGAINEFGKTFPDHHSYTADDLQEFVDRCVLRSVDCVVTTEKDFVKLPENFVCPIPFYYLRIKIDIIKGRALLNRLLASISDTKTMPACPRFL